MRNGIYESHLEDFAASIFRIGLELLHYPEDGGSKRRQKSVIMYHYIQRHIKYHSKRYMQPNCSTLFHSFHPLTT
jgi:hypothetical protein